MANYSLVIDSTFQPFSFERYIQPYQIYDQAYREVEDNLSDLEMEAGQWDKLANEATDPETHATYRKYADDLRKQADKLSKYGLNPQSRRGMLNMRRRFSSEIVPIVTAYNRRRQLADEQRQRNADGTLRFSTDFSKVSLDDMIANPELSYSTVSGHEVMERASQMFSRLAAVVNKEPSVSKRADLKGYLQILRQSGYDPEVALQEYGAEMPAEIKKVYDNIDKSFANEPAYDREWGHSWIGQAAYNAIGTKAYEIMDDKMVMSAAQAAADRRAGQEIAYKYAALKQDDKHFNAEMDFKKQQLKAAQDTTANANDPLAGAFNSDGTYNPTWIASLSRRGMMLDGNGNPTNASGPSVYYGKGLSSGKGNFKRANGKDYDFSDGQPFAVDHSNANSHIVRDMRQFVADYFNLPQDAEGNYLKNGTIADMITRKLIVYRDRDWVPGSNNEFMIGMPGIDMDTGKVLETKKGEADYMKFIDYSNSLLKEVYNEQHRK